MVHRQGDPGQIVLYIHGTHPYLHTPLVCLLSGSVNKHLSKEYGNIRIIHDCTCTCNYLMAFSHLKGMSQYYNDLNLERASHRAQYTVMSCGDRSRGTPTHSPRYTLLVIESSWQSLGHDMPSPSPCLSSIFLLFWSVLTELARPLNQYTYISTVRPTANDRIDANATLL